ncbi:MAG: glycerol-3-phosphate acyltransferase [Ardenticatenaceae bacterium]|nr:glycerol-3-phosphate acyltransferase [Ardenticatenaceae bacterium]
MTPFQILWVFISYLFGALPLALWIGRLAGYDIREYGDGNPGATNVLRAAGLRLGATAYLAEISKAAVPVGLANYIFGWSGLVLIPISLAPSLGHAFSIFLSGRGGKALASIMGVWIGLTLYEMPLVMLPVLVLCFILLDNDGWSVLIAGGVGLLYLLIFNPDPIFLAVLVLQLLLVIWTHRTDLRGRPGVRERWLKDKRPETRD